MERYETAEIEFADLSEDVITASDFTNSTSAPAIVCCTPYVNLESSEPYEPKGWTVTYDNGDSVYVPGANPPDGCF